MEEDIKNILTSLLNILQSSNTNLENTNLLDERKSEVTQKNTSAKNTVLITNFRDTAKLLGVRENLLVNYLLINNICYRDSKSTIKPYAKYMEYFALRGFTTESGHSGIQTLINEKGRNYIKNLLINEKIIKENNLVEMGEDYVK